MLIKTIVALALIGFVLTPPVSTFAAAQDAKAELASIAAVEGASIKILSPADGAHLKAGVEYPITYEVKTGKGGDHFHVYVDEKSGPSTYEAKGVDTIPGLTPGEHIISIRIVGKDHVPIGPKKSIRVIVDPDYKR